MEWIAKLMIACGLTVSALALSPQIGYAGNLYGQLFPGFILPPPVYEMLPNSIKSPRPAPLGYTYGDDATVYFEATDGSCSGTHIGGGRILTAGHCLVYKEDYSNMRYVVNGDKEALIRWVDKQLDLAELQVTDAKWATSYPSAAISCRGYGPGTEVVTKGFPGAVAYVVSYGRLISEVINGGKGFWKTLQFFTGVGAPGSSGSGVYTVDEGNHRVIGTFNGIINKGTGFLVMVPLSASKWFCPPSIEHKQAHTIEVKK